MTDSIIPASVKLAAKRAFIRTTAQAYAATLTTGISASVIIGIVTGQVEVVPIIVTLAVALLSPPIAGAAAYLDIMSKGMPADYADVTLARLSVLDNDERLTDIEVARGNILRKDLK